MVTGGGGDKPDSKARRGDQARTHPPPELPESGGAGGPPAAPAGPFLDPKIGDGGHHLRRLLHTQRRPGELHSRRHGVGPFSVGSSHGVPAGAVHGGRRRRRRGGV